MASRFTPDQQAAFVEEEIRAWIREDVEPALRAAIRKREKRIPDETLQNLRHEVYGEMGAIMGEYRLHFQDSGRHVDMRSIEFRSRPISRDRNFILDWAKKRGLSRFRKGVPGYKRGSRTRSRLTEEQALQRIASAIIVAKRKRGRYRPKGKWYNKTMYRLIGRLTGRLTRNQARWIQGFTREQIEEAFKLDKGPIRIK